uniref:Uncharacterized protein n=1 Tax=Schistocephalus solidus TaxID=70667 RepID=A0A0X3P5U4_SCHSO
MIRKVQGKNIQRIMQTLQRNCDSFDEPTNCDLSRTSVPSSVSVRGYRRDDEWIKLHENDDNSDEGEGKEPMFSVNISRTVKFGPTGSKKDEKPTPVAHSGEIRPTTTPPVLQVHPVQAETVSRSTIRKKSYPDNGASKDFQTSEKEDLRTPKSPSTAVLEPLHGSQTVDYVPLRTREATQSSAYWSVPSPKTGDPSPLSVKSPEVKVSPVATPRKQELSVTPISSRLHNDSRDNEGPQAANSADVVQTAKPPSSSSPSISGQKSPNISPRNGQPLLTKRLFTSDEEERTGAANKSPVDKQLPALRTGKQETSEIQRIVPSPRADLLLMNPQNNGQAPSGNENTFRLNSTSRDETSDCEEPIHSKINGCNLSHCLSTSPSKNAPNFSVNGNKEDNGIEQYSKFEASHEMSKVDTEDNQNENIDTSLAPEADTPLIQVSPTLNKKVIELLDTWSSNGGKLSLDCDTKTTYNSDRIYGGRAVSPTVNKFDDIIFYARTFNEDLQSYLLEAKVRRKYSQCNYTPTVVTTKVLAPSKVHSPAPAPVYSNEGSDVDEAIGNVEPKIIYASRCPS